MSGKLSANMENYERHALNFAIKGGIGESHVALHFFTLTLIQVLYNCTTLLHKYIRAAIIRTSDDPI